MTSLDANIPSVRNPYAPAEKIDVESLILFSGTLLVSIIILSCIIGLIFLRNKDIEEATNNLNSLSVILSEQTSLAFHEIDTVIKESRALLQLNNAVQPSDITLHQQLHRLFQGFLQGQALLVFGPDGKMLAHSREYPTPAVNVRDRAYFKEHAASPEDTLSISKPLRNRVNGNWMISLSRRISSSDGEFLGVIMAAVEMNYFNRLYASLELPPHMTIDLTKHDGTLLAVFPLNEKAFGTRLTPPGDPNDLITAQHDVSDLPITIRLALPKREALRLWYNVAWILCPGTLAAILGIAAFTKVLLLLVRKYKQQTAEHNQHLEQQIHERTLSLQDTVEFTKKIIDTSPIGIAVYRRDGQCVSLNNVFSDTVQISRETLLANPLSSLVTLEPSGLLDCANKTLATGQTTIKEGSFHSESGQEIWINYQIARFARNAVEHLLVLASDVTARKHMEQELRSLAFTDSLTGVNNRRRFFALAENECARAIRTGHTFALLILDIDHFKNINDSYGHDQGDTVLTRLADICIKALRINDIFGRIGGEEFGAVLIESSLESAMLASERLRQMIEGTAVPTATSAISFTISIGVSLWQGEHDTIDLLMQRADKALYAAKNQGRNRVVTA